jgi:hypothetical protein
LVFMWLSGGRELDCSGLYGEWRDYLG